MQEEIQGDGWREAEAEGASKLSKKRRRLPIVLGVVAVVVAIAGVGAYVWHEQPGFCGAVCHDTMGPYLETYESSAFLVHNHAEAGVTCLDCHEAELSTQLQELQTQISGNYRTPLAKMETDDEFCLREGCHTRESIVEAGEKVTFGDGTSVNPHSITFSSNYGSTESPHSVPGETIACSTCHSSHRKSAKLDYCYGCHHTETTKSCYECHDHR